MSQSARLRNLSSSDKSSTARICVSPRALSALTRFDPMKPAAPVTTMYTSHSEFCRCAGDERLQLDIESAELRDDKWNARSDCTQQFVANRAYRRSHVIDRQSRAPQNDGAADGGLRHIRQVDGHQIHRNASRRADFLAAYQHRRAVGRMPRVTIGVAACDHTDSMRARGGISAAVSNAFVRLDLLHCDQFAPQGHHRLKAQHFRRIVRKR